MTRPDTDLEDLLDRLVAEYSDRINRGEEVAVEDFVNRAPVSCRPGLRRCLEMIDSGMAPHLETLEPLGPGLLLDEFRIVELAGRGGMSLVFRARQDSLGRDVALKVLRPALATEGRHVERFQREGRSVARLTHASAVEVFAVGEARGYHYLAMEWIPGPNLAEVLSELPAGGERTSADLARASGIEALDRPGVSFERSIAGLLAPVARAVAAAHALGIVHRDLKPSNILVHPDGRVKVADFGLAKGADDPALSLTGEPLGTPYYMSPEQVARSSVPVDARTDVYSLGVTLYEALSGSKPFHGDSALAVFESIRRHVPKAIRSHHPGVTGAAQAVVEMAMSRDPDGRYQTATGLAADLEALARGEPTKAQAALGGPIRRSLRATGKVLSGQRYEYRSAASLFGLPLLHINSGRRSRGKRPAVARGWIAVGSVAIGVVSFGSVALGVVALGVVSAGLLCLAGAIAVGGIAVGGGVGVGGLAAGGGAVGYASVGGYAAGYYALGGKAHARYQISGMRVDQEAIDWFDRFLPGFIDRLDVPRHRAASNRPHTPDTEDSEMLKELTTAAATALSLTAAQAEISEWKSVELRNKVQVSILHVADSPRQTFFTFLPLGLLADAPNRAQFSHLVEHMLIRSTDPDRLVVDGMRLNGETTALSLRLESIGEPERWKEALDRHGHWLSADTFDGKVLEAEKLRIASEEDSTVQNAYTGKWAQVAWNQVVRHGMEHAAVHGDVAAATLEQIHEYVEDFVPIGGMVRVVAVGPVSVEELTPELERVIGTLSPRPARGAGRVKELRSGEIAASWDLESHHFMEWYPVPDRAGSDRVAANVLAYLIGMRLSADPTLTSAGIMAMASADLVTPEGRFLLLSAGCRSADQVELARAAFARATDDPLGEMPNGVTIDMMISQLRNQSLSVPDFSALRRAYAGRPGAEFLEAQVALNHVSGRQTVGLYSDAELAAAYDDLSADLVRGIAGDALADESRSSLLLTPAR